MNHLKLLLCFLLSLMSYSATATLHLESTKKTKPIKGFAPFMQSIGTQMDAKEGYVFDENNQPVTAVNHILSIPSLLCNYDENKVSHNDLIPFFDFQDQDNDICDINNAGTINWYILDPNENDWQSITNWEQLSPRLINNISFPGSLLPPGNINTSLYTQALKIPIEAAGKRIGFTYTPYARTGTPRAGQSIKVWDLDYFFGQSPYLEPGIPSNPNDGVKLNQNLNAGGGNVTNFAQPDIDSLRMKGIFAVTQSIEVEYTFYANTFGNFEDVSRIWWGKQGTTANLAKFDNPNYTTSKSSPLLSASDVGSIYEVTVLPIRKEAGYYIVGRAASVLSNDPRNEFPKPPSIDNLAFTDDIFLLKPISATYDFNHGGAVGAKDMSKYTWSYRNVLDQLVSLSTGTIIDSGKVPDSPVISHTIAGRMIELKVEPFDDLSRNGTPITITSRAEALEYVAITPRTLTFTVGDTQSQSLTANGYYSKGTVADISNLGNWQSNDFDIMVNNIGVVTISPNNTAAKSGLITFNYNGMSDAANVIIQSAMTLELEIVQNNAIANESSNSIRAIVKDGQGVPVSNARVNFNTTNSNIMISPTTAVTNSEGMITINVNKNTTGSSQATINATLSGTDTTQSVIVNFLGLREVNRIIAPQNYTFYPYQNFPTTGFDNASFTIIADNIINNGSLVWSSSDPTAASVTGEGIVTLQESSLRKSIRITAKNDTYAYRYEFKIDKWFMAPKFYKYDPGLAYCTSINAKIPARMELSQGKGVRGIGSLWSEWHKPPTWVQGKDTHYWSSTENSFRRVYVIDIITGENTLIKGNDGAYSEYTSCMKQ